MSNIIQFPTSERVRQVLDEKIDNVINREEQAEIQREECVELAHYCFQLIDQAISGNEFIDGFENMDFLDLSKQEGRDISVIINLLAATFYRYKGLEHPFQEDLDISDAKLDTLMGPANIATEAELELELQELEELLKESEEDDID